MDRKSTFTAIAVLCLLGLIASLITMPSDTSQAWPWGRHMIVVDDGGGPAPAKREGIIGLSKRTLANAENITEAVKAGISAAGKVIDRTETKSEQPAAAREAVREVFKAAAPPVVVEMPLPVLPASESKAGTWQPQADGSQRLTDAAGNQWQYTEAFGVVQLGCDGGNCNGGSCSVSTGIFGRRGR